MDRSVDNPIGFVNHFMLFSFGSQPVRCCGSDEFGSLVENTEGNLVPTRSPPAAPVFVATQDK